jgi:hypothetical protein
MMKPSYLSDIVRQPLLHFFVIGALIYAAYAFMGAPDAEENERRISVTQGEIASLQESWKKRWNRPPTSQELQGIVKQSLRERVLAREATAMGLDKDDIVIRRRLSQKLEYLSQDLLGGGAPSDEELAAFFAKNAKTYEVPALVTMTHIFFDPDKRGDKTLEAAKNQKPRLAALKVPPEDARGYGDPFMLQTYYPERTYGELTKLFGTGFVETVSGLSQGEWHGPVLSGYGVHLVYIHNREDARPAKLADVKDRVLLDWQEKRRKDLSEKYLSGLLERYQVRIESQEPALKTLERSGAE